MVEMNSPGVYVTEIDASEIVPSTSSSVGVFSGNFTKGQVEKYTQITSVDDLIEFYGRPNNSNYNDWYQAYNFLQYGNNLLISRAVNLNGVANDTHFTISDLLRKEDGYGLTSYGVDYGNTIDADEEIIIISIGNNTKKLEVGTIISFASNPSDAINKTITYKYMIKKCTVVNGYYHIVLDRNLQIMGNANPTTSDLETFYVGKRLYEVNVHFNGSGEALSNETLNHKVCKNTWKKVKINNVLTPYEIDVNVPNYLDNTDYATTSSDNTIERIDKQDNNSSILFETNKQILNDDDFEYKFDSFSFANASSKLKFFSRTLGTEASRYQISIALPRDFASNDNDHIGNHCLKYAQKGISVDSLFEYAPADNSAQIAVFIYDLINQEMKETYLCSLDPDEMDSYNNSMYIEKLINRNSNCVYVKCNEALPITKTVTIDKFDDFGNVLTDNNGNNLKETIIVPNVESYTLVADFNGNYAGNLINLYCATDSEIQQDDLLNAYEVFENKELIDIDIVISNELDNGRSALNLVEGRKDCIAFLGIPREYTFTDGSTQTLTISKKSSEATTNIVRFRKDSNINYNSMWISLVANYKYQYDRYNDTYRWVNMAGDVAGLRAETNQTNAPWWASAGLNRGQIKNVTKLAYSPNQTQRGTLYTNGINSIVTFPGQGTVLWGQKTMLDKASSFDRVNVRCLFNTLERALAKMSKYQVMEFNDTFTRNRIISIMKPYLASVQAERGIQDYMVVCDTSNNTPDVISRNQLVVDIYIKPTYVAEFIRLNFINCGVNDFSTIISNN